MVWGVGAPNATLFKGQLYFIPIISMYVCYVKCYKVHFLQWILGKYFLKYWARMHSEFSLSFP